MKTAPSYGTTPPINDGPASYRHCSRTDAPPLETLDALAIMIPPRRTEEIFSMAGRWILLFGHVGGRARARSGPTAAA